MLRSEGQQACGPLPSASYAALQSSRPPEFLQAVTSELDGMDS